MMALEIEALTQILNEKEVEFTSIDDIQNNEAFSNIVEDIDDLKALNIKYLVKLSIVCKFPENGVKFKFIDVVMKNAVLVHALPAIQLILALPDSYPSHSKPMFL